MDGFPSGQRGQTVNLLATLSVVRIHLHPFLIFEKTRNACNFGKRVETKRGKRSSRAKRSNQWRWRGVEQLEARRAHNPEVVGSNPSPATHFFKVFAQVAQLVEQRTENPRVTGSIPVLGIFYLSFYPVIDRFFCFKVFFYIRVFYFKLFFKFSSFS